MAGAALIAGQKSGVVYALDPDSWAGKSGGRGLVQGAAGGIMAASAQQMNGMSTSRLSGCRQSVFAPPQNADPWNRRLPYICLAVEPCPPRLRSSDSGGGTFALSLESGERVWYSPPQCEDGKPRCQPGQMGAVTGIPGIVFSETLDGHVRVYATNAGRVVWSAPTGGSISRAGSGDCGGRALYEYC